MNINWNNVELVIFDVDGTLYDQSRLRKKMGRTLIGHYMFRPWSAYDLQIIRVFRKERELMNFNPVKNIENAQYELCAKKIKAPAENVKKVVEKWMYQAPLQYLQECSFPGVRDFFVSLKKQNIKIAIYSDYPAKEKLQAMGLEADMIVSSTDKEVDSLKPSPNGLTYIMKNFNFPVEKCLFIGDRDELDGECARKIGMQYYILSNDDKRSDFYKALAKTVIKNKN
ncbi:HAD family hydrolase [Cesiribacter sp. SM1]|uniref:HAD family hydrolase n=1 Tax=Cesiribacter sp. SM1 TaxID=2861196 RepID=UPI001CD5654D|nr:HAD family hydrolase [Cesiribacter sp. SM1]